MENYLKSNSVIAFMDILGFKKLIDKIENGDSSIIEKLTSCLKNALRCIELINRINTRSMLMAPDIFGCDIDLTHINTKINHTQVSDAIVLSCDYVLDTGDHVLDAVLHEVAFSSVATMAAIYQSFLLNEGYYVRGGIADGHWAKSGNIIFSGAYLKAYKLEQDVAVYPRIVIDEKLVKRTDITGELDNSSEEVCFYLAMQMPHILVKDSMGSIFLNSFQLGNDLYCLSTDYKGFLERVEHVIENDPDLYNDVTEIGRIMEPIADVSRLTETVWSNLQTELFAKTDDKDDPKKYGKLLWLREFLSWVQNVECALEFQYLSSDIHRVERDGVSSHII